MLTKKLCIFTIMLVVGSPLVFAQYQHTEEYSGAQIQDRLYHAKVFEHGKVTVAFKNGVATLTGTVDSLGVKMDAEKAARKVDDVQQLVDNLTVHAEDVTTRQILERARLEVVTYFNYSIFDWVSLEGEGGKLIVNGYVSQPFKKSDICWFLAHIKGVAELQNNIEVLPVSGFDDEIRIAVARSIYNDPFFIQYAGVANPSIHIIVKNGNVTLEGSVNSLLDKVKAESDARSAATYFGFTNNLQVEKH